MLSKNIKVKNTDIFTIPIIGMDMSWDELIQEYPHLENEMDGSDEGSFLGIFYKKNPVNSIYGFIDEDAESDMADIFGFDLNICTKGESNKEKAIRNNEEIINNIFENENFEDLEEFDEIKEKLKGKLLKKELKQQKKDRREKILLERENV